MSYEKPMSSELEKATAVTDPPNTKEECYPDRWERIWNALGEESASDKATASISKAWEKLPAKEKKVCRQRVKATLEGLDKIAKAALIRGE